MLFGKRKEKGDYKDDEPEAQGTEVTHESGEVVRGQVTLGPSNV